jgi:hypothetical protein
LGCGSRADSSLFPAIAKPWPLCSIFPQTMTKSEKFVADLCEMSFLPFWSFPSPIGKKGNELCDLLVVCENTIIIISVKDIAPSNHEDEMIVYDRWTKKAIHQSVSQIYGAERYLKSVDTIQLKNSTYSVQLPPKEKRIIHRVAIAFGSKPDYPFPIGDFEEGFVNVFDEKATTTILKELDTITDFTNYLEAKQKFLEKSNTLLPYETDFLALYIQTGLHFEHNEKMLLVGEGLWEAYIDSEDYKKWQTDIEVSYFWDIMIQSLYINHVKPGITSQKRNDIERAIRLINLEPRINRLELGMVLENTIKSGVKARMIKPLPGSEHSYLFMPMQQKNWNERGKEIDLRCFVARAEFPEAKKIIGIGIGRSPDGEDTFDIGYLDIPELDDKFIETANMIKEELGYFKNIRLTHSKDMRQ